MVDKMKKRKKVKNVPKYSAKFTKSKKTPERSASDISILLDMCDPFLVAFFSYFENHSLSHFEIMCGVLF